ncbi:MAG: triose-phosphate isomerase [Nanoarchaeota archaeon]|nr:triose-phosphate isomerase [Nanoarchaeota archaeon]
MVKLIIAANWKMNKTRKEAASLIKKVRPILNNKQREVVIFPPFTCLDVVSKLLKGKSAKFGAQNMHYETKGPYTGEISVDMLKEVGCSYVLIGHSERRINCNENDEDVNRKIRTAVENEFTPILCIGENLDERESERTDAILEEQIRNGLNGLTKDKVLKVVIAYEPIWAIGTGRSATTEQASHAHSEIRKLLTNMYDRDVAQKMRILYGGSVTSENISSLLRGKGIDGFLVGGASLKPDEFIKIVKAKPKVVR